MVKKKEGEYGTCVPSPSSSPRRIASSPRVSFQSGRPFRRSLSGELTVRTVSPGGRFHHREIWSVGGLLPFGSASLDDFLSTGRGFSRDLFLIREADRGDCSRRIKLPSAISIPSEVTPVGIPVRENRLQESCPSGKLVLRPGKGPLQEILRPGTGTCRGEKPEKELLP